MRVLTLLTVTALLSAPLMGQSAKEIADNLTLPPLAPGAKKLPMPTAPDGAKIEFGGADYEQIIAPDGSISKVLSDVNVNVFFKVTKNGQTVDSKDYVVVVQPAEAPAAGANPKPTTIPAILQWRGKTGEWKPGKTVHIYDNDAIDAHAFAAELRIILPKGTDVKITKNMDQADIVLTVSPNAPEDAVDAYRMKVSPEKVRITGDSKAGAFMGTRTLLQILTNKGAIPCGEARDIPRYKVRGLMMEIARTPYALQDLRDLVNLMAWYKMNDLHLGINNNYIFHEHYVNTQRDPLKESYSAFRLESKVKGKDGTRLTAQDLFYTKKEFREFIDYAKARGVNVVPEIDTPGHALSFTRVRPDLIYQGPMRHHPNRRCEMLDAANPATIKFVGKVFDEYLLRDRKLGRAVFEGCVVHVGSDEFFGAAEDYRKYADGVLTHVLKRGYTPRIWGSLSAKPGKTPVVSKGVQMNIWSKDWMLPFPAIEQGYQIINTFDRDLYIVPFEGYYRMDRNHKGVYNNWIPNKMGNQQVPAGHPQLLGAAFAVWNDHCDLLHNGYGWADIRDSISGSLDVLCGRLWGEQQRTLSFEQHRQLVKEIGTGSASLIRKIPNAPYTLKGEPPYRLNSPALQPPYHLTIENVTLTKATPGEEQVLLSGPEGMLFAAMKDGTIGFRRADTMEFSWDAKLPEGKPVKLELIATLGKTRLLIDGKEVETLTLKNFKSRSEDFRNPTKGLISTFILPGNTLGAKMDGTSLFQGTVGKVEVTE